MAFSPVTAFTIELQSECAGEFVLVSYSAYVEYLMRIKATISVTFVFCLPAKQDWKTVNNFHVRVRRKNPVTGKFVSFVLLPFCRLCCHLRAASAVQ